jgi:NADH-quinone oxidoreductase subunit K
LAAAEAAIGLAILLQFYHRFRNLDVNQASRLKG